MVVQKRKHILKREDADCQPYVTCRQDTKTIADMLITNDFLHFSQTSPTFSLLMLEN